MQLEPEFQAPHAPKLAIGNLPIDEQEIGWSIYLNLNSLSDEANNIAAAIALFELGRSNGAHGLYGTWMQIAARDGALTIRNFGKALSKIRSLIGRIKSWLPLVDSDALKVAALRFDEKFPFADKLRHAVAHPEFYNDPNKKMGIDGDLDDIGIKAENVKNLSIKGQITDCTYASSIEGILVKYDLTRDTLEAIFDIVHQVFDAFAPPTATGIRRFPPS